MNKEQKLTIEQIINCVEQCKALCEDNQDGLIQIARVEYSYYTGDTTVTVFCGIEAIGDAIGQSVGNYCSEDGLIRWKEVRSDGIVFIQQDGGKWA